MRHARDGAGAIPRRGPRTKDLAVTPFGGQLFRTELVYVVLIFALFVLPRVLQRFRLPPAITSFALGAFASAGMGWFGHDPTMELLSTLGIVSLFLFAGLELEAAELRVNAWVLTQHLAIRVALLGAVAVLVRAVFPLDWRPALLVALALVTPSTGFILDSIRTFGFTPAEESWVKLKAIATELLALAVLFAVTQSSTVPRFTMSALALVLMVLLLPIVFRGFARAIVPHAPGSEFGFLLMVAVLCAVATRELGVYYLVGAFVVGVAAQRFREQLPALASRGMLRAVELFASFFIPFYFFHAGSQIRREDFSLEPALAGLGMVLLVLPLRLAVVAVHRGLVLREPPRASLRIGVALLPTLVFTLVLAEILRSEYRVPPVVFGGLILYTVVNTLIPGLIFKLPTTDMTRPQVGGPNE
jgi:Kef-type K+ transport system membrane component KefB